MGASFRVPEPRRLPDPKGAVRPEDCLPVIPLFFVEIRLVRHRIDAIGIELQCLFEAAGGVGLVTESKQGGAFVVPRRGVLRPKRKDFLVAPDCPGVILQFMEDRALVDPCIKRSWVERQQAIVRVGLFLPPPEFVQHRPEAHPAFLRVPVASQRLHEGVEGAFSIARLLEYGALENPRRVVFRFEPERGAELSQGGIRVPPFKGAPRSMHRRLEAIHAREEPLGRVGCQRHSFVSDGMCRAHVSRHFLASSWFGLSESARSYASRASRNRSSCCKATPFPVHASALRGSRSIACSYRRRPICGSPPSIASSASCRTTCVSSFSGSIDSTNDWKSAGTEETCESSSSSIAANAFARDGRSVMGSNGSEAGGAGPVMCAIASRAARTVSWSAPRRVALASDASASPRRPSA